MPGSNGPGFTVRGRTYATRNASDTLVRFFQVLANEDSTFLERFSALARHGRRRRYVARNRLDLYPDRADLAAEHSKEFVPGWRVGTNYSAEQIRKIMALAAQVAGLTMGVEIQVRV
jgi:predicted type IV restriction endonuclease